MSNVIEKASYCLLLTSFFYYAPALNAKAEVAPVVRSSLSKSYALYQEGNYRQAESLLNDVRAQSKGSDLALVQQMLGYVYYAEKKYDAALDAFNAALQQGDLPKEVIQKLHRVLGEILILEKKKYLSGLGHLTLWLKKEETPDQSVRTLIAIAYQELEDYASLANFLLSDSEKINQLSKQQSELLLFSYIKLHRIDEAKKILVQLIQRFPDNPVYWQQLSALYRQGKKNITAGLAVDSIAYHNGTANDEQGILRLVKRYLGADLPYQAARVLKREIASGNVVQTEKLLLLLVNSYLLAKEAEKAIAVLEAMPSSPAKTTYLIEAHFWQSLWSPLVSYAKKIPSTDKEGLTERSKLLLGIAHYRFGDMENARLFLRQIKKDKKNQVLARQWLKRIPTEH